MYIDRATAQHLELVRNLRSGTGSNSLFEIINFTKTVSIYLSISGFNSRFISCIRKSELNYSKQIFCSRWQVGIENLENCSYQLSRHYLHFRAIWYGWAIIKVILFVSTILSFIWLLEKKWTDFCWSHWYFEIVSWLRQASLSALHLSKDYHCSIHSWWNRCAKHASRCY